MTYFTVTSPRGRLVWNPEQKRQDYKRVAVARLVFNGTVEGQGATMQDAINNLRARLLEVTELSPSPAIEVKA